MCEHCWVRCQGWYEDDGFGRLRLTICPSCGNGDPQLIVDDYIDESLDPNLRFLLFLMRGDDADAEMG